MTKKKFTKTYGQDAPWLDPLLLDPSKLEMIGEKRHTLVEEIAQANDSTIDGALTGAVEYEVARDLYENLPASTAARYPDAAGFVNTRGREQRARLMQRLLTDLAKRMEYVELPPPPPQGGGGGGGSGGGGGGGNPPPRGQAPQRPGSGQGQPQKGTGSTPAPAPAKAPAKPQAPKPAPAAPAPAPAGGQQPPQKETKAPAADPRMTEVTTKLDEADQQLEHGGGGVQYRANTKNAGMFYAIRYIIQRLAVDVDWLETTPEGRDTWNLGRVFRSGYNPNYLRNAQDDRRVTVDEMYLSLDTSGSVLTYAEEIAAMAAGAVGLVRLFHGTEGKPQIEIRRKSPLAYPGQAFPEWDHGRDARLVRNPSLSSDEINGAAQAAGGRHYSQYSPESEQFLTAWMREQEANYPRLRGNWHSECFEAHVAWWLHVYRPAPGTRLLFWGDTQSVHFANPWLLKQMMRNYRFVWMTPYTPKVLDHYLAYYGGEQALHQMFAAGDFNIAVEYPKLEYVGLPVLHGVNSAASVRQALRRIQTL